MSHSKLIYIAFHCKLHSSVILLLPFSLLTAPFSQVGPAGAQFGLLACLIVEVLQSWQMLKSPFKAIGKLLGIIGFLFVLGLLPWIDNFAHLGGFICGILLSFIFLPYICFGEFDKRRKRIQIFVCSILLLAYYVLAIVLFYITPIRDCSWCQYFNCIPLTEDFCNDMELRLEDRSTLWWQQSLDCQRQTDRQTERSQLQTEINSEVYQ